MSERKNGSNAFQLLEADGREFEQPPSEINEFVQQVKTALESSNPDTMQILELDVFAERVDLIFTALNEDFLHVRSHIGFIQSKGNDRLYLDNFVAIRLKVSYLLTILKDAYTEHSPQYQAVKNVNDLLTQIIDFLYNQRDHLKIDA